MKNKGKYIYYIINQSHDKKETFSSYLNLQFQMTIPTHTSYDKGGRGEEEAWD